ncbi:MAG: carbohydrate kinase family protein, partial [Pseudomonadota bacterium]
AYDNIMVFEGKFKDYILPDKIHILNVSFLVPQLRREYGGCAGNIAFNLTQLGADCFAVGSVGHDFGDYKAWMDNKGVSSRFVIEESDAYTAHAYITTDLDDNQITAFHPGAMSLAGKQQMPTGTGTIGIISPNAPDAMVAHAAQFADQGIPFVFDPGQLLPAFDGDQLKKFIEQATWIAVNDYEGQLLQERTGLTTQEVAAQVEAFVVTLGSEGSVIMAQEEEYKIPNITPVAIKDPTGCGDAYRAGLLYGLMQDMDWETTGRIASVLGGLKIAHHGTQNHPCTIDAVKEKFSQEFGYSFE